MRQILVDLRQNQRNNEDSLNNEKWGFSFLHTIQIKYRGSLFSLAFSRNDRHLSLIVKMYY